MEDQNPFEPGLWSIRDEIRKFYEYAENEINKLNLEISKCSCGYEPTLYYWGDIGGILWPIFHCNACDFKPWPDKKNMHDCVAFWNLKVSEEGP